MDRTVPYSRTAPTNPRGHVRVFRERDVRRQWIMKHIRREYKPDRRNPTAFSSRKRRRAARVKLPAVPQRCLAFFCLAERTVFVRCEQYGECGTLAHRVFSNQSRAARSSQDESKQTFHVQCRRCVSIDGAAPARTRLPIPNVRASRIPKTSLDSSGDNRQMSSRKLYCVRDGGRLAGGLEGGRILGQ